MIYCITLIIVVALICATRLYPLWLRHDYKRTRKALELVRKVRDENDRLRKEIDRAYDSWFTEYDRSQKSQNRAWDLIVEIAEKMNIKLD
ncbi:hypothetical protein [Muribaculum intestinale]|uniref:hypothetical protein n=1 Tax=Muribaculum intestinale TaxID=1796646 RepID=UPI0027295748|nr:hypothetical protein [Muribaculum intestinale]